MLTVKVDHTQFDRALTQYLKVSKKGLREILNRKAAIIASSASRNTKRADREKIQSDLGRFVTVQETTKKGTTRNRRALQLNTRKGHSAPLAELIINKRRARVGEKGLEGAELSAAVRKMIAGRLRSVSFLASGWLPAVRDLLPFIEQKSGLKVDRSARWYGRPKGAGFPAKLSIAPFAVIENRIAKAGAGQRYIEAGLQKAVNDETRSMGEYIEKQLAKEFASVH
jgi:hypothetical protein